MAVIPIHQADNTRGPAIRLHQAAQRPLALADDHVVHLGKVLDDPLAQGRDVRPSGDALGGRG